MSKYTEWLAKTGGPRVSGLNEAIDPFDPKNPLRYEISFNPLEVPGSDPPPEIADELDHLTIQARSSQTAILPRVRELLERFPDEKHLLNMLAAGLEAGGQKEQAREVAERNYLKNPDYLFARVNYAAFLLGGPDHEKVLDIFGGTFNLRAMYPHRTVFHATEVAGVMSIYAKYWVIKRDAIRANAAIAVLKEVDPDDPTLAFANEFMVLAALQKLSEGSKSNARQKKSPRPHSRHDRHGRKRR